MYPTNVGVSRRSEISAAIRPDEIFARNRFIQKVQFYMQIQEKNRRTRGITCGVVLHIHAIQKGNLVVGQNRVRIGAYRVVQTLG